MSEARADIGFKLVADLQTSTRRVKITVNPEVSQSPHGEPERTLESPGSHSRILQGRMTTNIVYTRSANIKICLLEGKK